MLFDLSSRRHRRVGVQIVAGIMVLLIAGGLILFGVGTGSSGGGLFGAFTGSSSSNNGNSVVSKQVKQAVTATQKNPKSPAAWAALVSARYSAANTAGYDSATETYTAAGKTQLRYAGQAYAQYAKLVSKPSLNTSLLGARALSTTQQFAAASNAWQDVLTAKPGYREGLECTAITANAAGNTRVATLAEDKLLAQLSKKEQKSLKTELTQLKKSKAESAEIC